MFIKEGFSSQKLIILFSQIFRRTCHSSCLYLFRKLHWRLKFRRFLRVWFLSNGWSAFGRSQTDILMIDNLAWLTTVERFWLLHCFLLFLRPLRPLTGLVAFTSYFQNIFASFIILYHQHTIRFPHLWQCFVHLGVLPPQTRQDVLYVVC